MKSTMLKSYDLQKAIDEWIWKSEVNEGAVQEDIYQVCLKYKTYQTQSDVWAEDIVSVKLSSQMKKFNRIVKIRVGSKLFDVSLEQELIGKNVGQEYVFQHESGEVKYTVLESKRLIVPFLTDEMAKAENIEGVTSMNGMIDYFRKQDLYDKIYGESYEFVDTFLNKCEFIISEEELHAYEEDEMERCRAIGREEGVDFDTMSEQEMLGAVGCRNIAEFRAMIRDLFTREMQGACYAVEKLGVKPVKTFNDVLDGYVVLLDEIRDRAMKKKMMETVR